MAKAKNEIVIPPGRLWPNTPSGSPLDIEVFGSSGEFQSGKTLLGLSIAPGAHPGEHLFAGQPRTLYLDFEKSGATYGGTGCKRLDFPTMMLEKNIEHTPYNVFKTFLDLIEKLQPQQFDVIAADPITDIESGLVDYVKKNCSQFGLSSNQVAKAGGLLWGAVKDYWKQVLLKLSTRCQCFYFTAHMRDVWDGDKPVRGKREPKGKETLMELASLYLLLERKPDDNGVVPKAPSAIVLKQRLADTVMTPDGKLDIINLLPPRLPVATVGAIRQYIATPPDYSKLKTGERVIEQKTSEEDMERLRLARAEAERDTEENRIERLKRQAELQAAAKRAETEKPQSPDQSAVKQAEKAERKKAEITPEETAVDAAAVSEELTAKADAETKRLMDNQPLEHRQPGKATKATADQVGKVRDLAALLGLNRDTLKSLAQKGGAEKVSDLSPDMCKRLIAKLQQSLDAKKAETKAAGKEATKTKK